MIKEGCEVREAGLLLDDLLKGKRAVNTSSPKEANQAKPAAQPENAPGEQGRNLTFEERGLKLIALDPSHEEIVRLGLEPETVMALGAGYAERGIGLAASFAPYVCVVAMIGHALFLTPHFLKGWSFSFFAHEAEVIADELPAKMAEPAKARAMAGDVVRAASDPANFGAFPDVDGRKLDEAAKSTLLLRMILDDIDSGRGVCVIDPHGTLVERILAEIYLCDPVMFPQYYPGAKRRITLIEPGRSDFVTPINPLSGHENIVVGAQRVRNAILASWGQADDIETPRLSRLMHITIQLLMEANLSLADALHLLSNREAREDALSKASPAIADQWRMLNKLREVDYVTYIESVLNRLFSFCLAPSSRLLFGSTGEGVKLYERVQRGEIVLVNLVPSGQMHDSTARTIGTLLINDLVETARRADTNKVKHSTLYIDEAHHFINNDIADAVEQLRKFGLHLVLSHQTLSQIKEQGDRIRGAIAGIQNKVIFGGCEITDTQVLATQIYANYIDYVEGKPGTSRPVVVGYRWESKEAYSFASSYTETDQSSEITTETLTEMEGRLASIGVEGRPSPLNFGGNIASPNAMNVDSIAGNARVPAAYAGQLGVNEGQSRATGHGRSSGRSSTRGESHGVSVSPHLVPVLGEGVAQLYSKDEQLFRKAAHLISLPIGQAVLSLGGAKPVTVDVLLPPDHPKEDLVFATRKGRRIAYNQGMKRGECRPREEIQREVDSRIVAKQVGWMDDGLDEPSSFRG